MPQLKAVRDTVQRVAEAISAALGLETEIVDAGLVIIGGTGKYRDRIGLVEEGGCIDGQYLYARVMRTGKTVLVKDPSKDLTYDPSSLEGTTEEMAEICTPIRAGDRVVGVIALVAFSADQKEHLIQNEESMVLFLERMAELLGSKALEQEFYQELQLAQNEMAAILETAHEGMLALDDEGFITYSNSKAGILLHAAGTDLSGQHLSRFMPESPALEVLKSGQGYTEREEIYQRGSKNLHFIVTANPFLNEERIAGVVISFRHISEARRLVYNLSGVNPEFSFADIIGESSIMEQVKGQALRVALGNSTVLITGESGTGKELFARAIHFASDRHKKPFVTVNCGAIPEALLESELFGYVGGAFTGALEKGKAGKFELADEGTIFLDEIGDMPLHLQVKLLHVLQKKTFERIGGTKSVHVNVRVIAATNRDLEKMIREKEFREDLYYRLSVIPLRIPPLRDRREDIPLLVDSMLKKYSQLLHKDMEACSPRVMNAFKEYLWPGNVRELENAVEYGVTMGLGRVMEADALPPRIKRFLEQAGGGDTRKNSLQDQLRDYEKEILSEMLNQYGKTLEDKQQMARDLGISRATLYRKLADHKLSHE